MIFPQTILIGLKHSKIILTGSFLEIIINVTLSILFINLWGIIGVAIATVVAYFFEKLLLVYLVYKKLNILPTHYIPVKLHFIYSFITFLAYFIVVYYL
jgi:Na+-driven multidrug efflux pump